MPLDIYRRSRASWLVSDNNYDTEQSHDLRRELYKNRGIAEANAALDACRDPAQRAHLAEALADWYDKPQALFARSDIHPLIRGIHGVKWAWRARGAQWTPQNYPEFQRRLREAHVQLTVAADSNPRDSVPWVWFIVCCRGLGDPAHGKEAFAEAIKRAPALRVAYSAMLLNCTPSWYGSEREATDFVQGALHAAPRDAGLETLACELHYFLQPHGGDLDAYWARPHIRASLLEANQRYFGSPKFKETIDSMRNRNWFACTLWKVGEFAATRPHLEAIGRTIQVLPWGQAHPIIDWAINPIRKARRDCLRA